MKWAPIVLLIFGASAEAKSVKEPEADFSGYKVLQATPYSSEDVSILRGLEDSATPGIDFWSSPSDVDSPVTLAVHPDVVDLVSVLFDEANITHEVHVDNLQSLVDEERKEIFEDADDGLTFRDPDPRNFDLSNYHRLNEITTYVDSLVASNSELMSKRALGTTGEGRSIEAVLVKLQDGKERPAIWIDCGIHAREWVSPAFCLYALDRLAGEKEAGLLRRFDFFIVPVANPDGYEYSWNTNRMWRKNRTPKGSSGGQVGATPSNPQVPPFGTFVTELATNNPFWGQYPSVLNSVANRRTGDVTTKQWGGLFGGKQDKCRGVDPNRNFNIAHCSKGASTNQCSDSYCGPAPFSEPESRAIRDGINSMIKEYGLSRTAAAVSVHAYSQLWMSPRGHSKKQSEHHGDLMRVMEKAVNKLRSVHGTEYKYGPISKIIYVASGSSVDWVHSKAGIKYSFGLELRDKGQRGFLLPKNEIAPTVEETWAGIEGMGWEIAKEYPVL